MKVKRIFALATVAAILSGIVTGCGGESVTSTSSSSGYSKSSVSESSEINIAEMQADDWSSCLTYEVTSKNEVEITDCTRDAVYVIIPDEIEGYPVTNIAKRAFYECSNLKAVAIGENVVSIGTEAFSTSGLEYITIPDSVTEIGESCFDYTPLYSDYDEGIIYIDGWAVGLASEESEIVFETGTRGISYQAFAKRDCIKKVIIPDIPLIAHSAFWYCNYLTSVSFGDGVETIGEYAFKNCPLLSDVDFGNNVSVISHSAFMECYNLTSVSLPESLTGIGETAFDSCGLTSITIPEGTTYISRGAFNGCSQLESITFEGMDCEIYEQTRQDTIPEDVVIRGYLGSTAEKYAKDWYYDFETIGGGNRDSSAAAENELCCSVKDVILGERFSAVITENGELYTFGTNEFGQLGNGTIEQTMEPVKILDDVESVCFGGNGSMRSGYYGAAITKDGSLYTWGKNEVGQLGNGTTEDSLSPVKILDHVSFVDLGCYHNAAITEDGSLYMWGENDYGQLGDGSTKNSTTPKKVMDHVVSVSLGYGHSGAISEEGILYMWGANNIGQIGDESRRDKLTPTKILDQVSSVELMMSNSAAVTNDGTLYMWGESDSGSCGNMVAYPYPIDILENVVSLSLSQSHSAAITDDGSLHTWGGNWSGQLGNGDKHDTARVQNVMDHVRSVELGLNYSAAITETGELYTWGNNQSGKLGNGTTEDNSEPIKIMDHVVSVSLGYAHCAAITEDGRLYMWGGNWDGECGNNITENSLTPVQVYIPAE